MTQHVTQELERKIKLGQQKIVGKTFLHTAPHHDDILLWYFPYALRNLAGNTNHVLYITSGANGVSDAYLAKHLSISQKDLELLDSATKQELKYGIRESESARKWQQVAGDRVHIKNLRAGFYDLSVEALAKLEAFGALAQKAEARKSLKSDDWCSSEKTYKRADQGYDQILESDIQRIVDYLYVVQPDIVTVLVDPVGIGPATHHRSQQVIMQALARYHSPKPIEIIGYRNVWSSFSLQDTDMIIPVTQNELNQMESVFQDCFATQTSILIFCEQDLELKNFAQQV